MIDWINRLSTSKKLAVAALLLGVLALFIGDPSNNKVINVNAQELALSIIKNQDRINVVTLADWLIKENLDFTLVDLRSEKEFNEYNIPYSVNIPVEHILTSDLMRNQKILLCGNDDVASAQAWFILKSSDYKAVYILKGGMEAWRNEILFPKFDSSATSEQKATFEKIKQVSLHFGGTPQIIAGGTASPVAMQTTSTTPAPKLLTAPGKSGGTKKKKEGC